MSTDQVQELQNRLDSISIEEFERDTRATEDAATQFFQDIFVEVLNFDPTPSPLGDKTWTDISVHEWPATAQGNSARLIGSHRNFRVLYIELEKLNRTAERAAIKSVTRSERTGGWALEGSFLAIVHAPGEDIWHLVTPYEEDSDDITTGRAVLRRYTIGEGETHRTVATALSQMDASRPERLSDRIDEAFRVQPVTEDFYEDYKSAFQSLTDELRAEGLEIEEADRYAHITLNRLMFIYYLQKKGWIGDRKDFMRWFLQQYETSSDNGEFHEDWLGTLFNEGMNQPSGTPITDDLPDDVAETISQIAFLNGGLFQPTDLDENGVFLSDPTLKQVIRQFLEQYNFTITEESPYDIDVAVDPAMLGKIYESLIAEQERGEAGIFYTPRVEVDLMCRMALYEQFCEHANDIDAEEKQQIVEFIFSEPQDWDAEHVDETKQLENILHELRIVDPACGSGAFLVGMKQVLTELYRKLGVTTDYHLKEQIINENLHGVDIKDWAVRVAEFRLWLSLVEGEEQFPDQRPVLPNFSFKLKVGDSLIQKLDGEFVSLDTLTRTFDGDTGELLTELKELKREHFEGEADRTQEIEEKQVELLQKHISGLIDNLSSNHSQGSLNEWAGGIEASEISGSKLDDEKTKERIEELQAVRAAIDEAGNSGFFMWDIDFSDVMVDGGFDIVIGNPPYVRQEDIIDQGIHPERLDEMDSSEVKKLKKQYKSDLVGYVDERFDIKPYKRSDIYVYFYFKGIDLLRENGTLSFITSNSWMDIGYGKRLHEGLLDLTDLSYIIGNTSMKSFEDADVNTYITLANRSNDGILAGDARFVRLSSQFHQYDYADDFLPFLTNNGESWSSIRLDDEQLLVKEENDVRTVCIDHASLWRLGGGKTQKADSTSNDVFSEATGLTPNQVPSNLDPGNEIHIPSGSYSDGAWGRFVDAPTLYFELWRDHHEKFDLLGEITEPTYGLKSGTNKFFFVPRPGDENTTFKSEYETDTGKLKLIHKETGREFRIEPKFWMRPIDEVPAAYHDQFDCQHEIDGEEHVPDLILVRNREITTSPIEPNHLNHVHITIDVPHNDVSKFDAGDYVEFGEEPRWGRSNDIRLPDRSSLSGRSPEWYSQPKINDAYIILTNTFNAQLQFHYNPCRFTVSNRFYYLPSAEEVRPGYLAGYLNSSFGWFMEEVTGRSWTNTLLFDKPEYLILPVLLADDETQSAIEDAVEELLDEEVGNVFEELGSYNLDNFSLDNVKGERKTLDQIFFDVLDFDEEQKVQIYKTIISMVRDRLMRQPDENPSLCETIAEHNPQYDYSR